MLPKIDLEKLQVDSITAYSQTKSYEYLTYEEISIWIKNGNFTYKYNTRLRTTEVYHNGLDIDSLLTDREKYIINEFAGKVFLENRDKILSGEIPCKCFLKGSDIMAICLLCFVVLALIIRYL